MQWGGGPLHACRVSDVKAVRGDGWVHHMGDVKQGTMMHYGTVQYGAECCYNGQSDLK